MSEAGGGYKGCWATVSMSWPQPLCTWACTGMSDGGDQHRSGVRVQSPLEGDLPGAVCGRDSLIPAGQSPSGDRESPQEEGAGTFFAGPPPEVPPPPPAPHTHINFSNQ